MKKLIGILFILLLLVVGGVKVYASHILINSKSDNNKELVAYNHLVGQNNILIDLLFDESDCDLELEGATSPSKNKKIEGFKLPAFNFNFAQNFCTSLIGKNIYFKSLYSHFSLSIYGNYAVIFITNCNWRI